MLDSSLIGKKYPVSKYVVALEKIREFARAIGDKNPLYSDEEFAKNSRHGEIIAPPTFCVIFAIKPFVDACTDPLLKINLTNLVHGEQDFYFFNPVKNGYEIFTEGQIVDIQAKRSLDFLTVETISRLKNNETVVKGLWTAIIANPS